MDWNGFGVHMTRMLRNLDRDERVRLQGLSFSRLWTDLLLSLQTHLEVGQPTEACVPEAHLDCSKVT